MSGVGCAATVLLILCVGIVGMPLIGGAQEFPESASVACLSQVYHVADEAPGASDANDGSSPTYQGGTIGPWKTLKHPAGGGVSMAGGDIVQVHNGTYNGTVDVRVAGTVDCPIVFRAAGTRAIIDGKGAGQAVLFNGNNRNLEWLIFDGFEVTGADTNFDVTRSQNITLRNLRVHDAFSTNINPITSHNITIEGSEIWGAQGEHGIYCSNGCDDLTIRNNSIHDNNWTGIQVNSNPDSSADKIAFRALIEHNIIYGNGAGGAGALTFASVRDSLVRNNLIRDNLAGGIILWAKNVAGYGSKNNVIVSNTVAFEPTKGRYALSLQDDSTGNLLADNILVSGSGPAFQYESGSQPFVSDHNVFHRPNGKIVHLLSTGTEYDLPQWQNASSHDRNSFASDPTSLFADPAQANFRLRPNAVAIDSGTSVPPEVPAADLEDRLRADDLTVPDKGAGPFTFYDIGTFEFPGVPPPPPQPLKAILTPASSITFPNASLRLQMRAEDSISKIGVPGASGTLDDGGAGGSFTGVADNGGGNYSAVYNPTWYPSTRNVALNASFSKNGHLPGSVSVEVQVLINGTAPVSQLKLLLSGDPTSVTNPDGLDLSMIVTIESNGTPVTGATITINDGGAGGRVDAVQDLGGGSYEARYTPRNVTAKSTIALNARASASGHKEAYASLVIEVRPSVQPPPPPPPPKNDSATDPFTSPVVLGGLVVAIGSVLAAIALLILRRRKPKEKYHAPNPAFLQER